MLFTTCTEKLTLTALCAQRFVCLSHHLQQQVIHNMYVNILHLQYVLPISCTSKLLAIHSNLTLDI